MMMILSPATLLLVLMSVTATMDFAKAEGNVHPECEEIVMEISGPGTSYAIWPGTPYPGNVSTFWEAKGFTNPVCDENNPNSWEFGTCQVGSFGGDLDAEYMSGEYSAFQPLSTLTFTELPTPKQGGPDHFIAKGEGWLYTNFCNKLKGTNVDEKEWINFNAISLQTQTNPAKCASTSYLTGDFSDLNDCLKGNFGSNVYSMDIEESNGACEGYWITLSLNYKSYFNPETQGGGCSPEYCSYFGQVCKLKNEEGGDQDNQEATNGATATEAPEEEGPHSPAEGRRLTKATRFINLLSNLVGIFPF